MSNRIGSRQVAWYEVHLFVASRLEGAVDEWPLAGTPEWCALPDDDARKIAAVLDAGQRDALRLETIQLQKAEASHDVVAAVDWPAIATGIYNRAAFYASKPWLKRVTV